MAERSSSTAARLERSVRPLLRGWSHALAAAGALVFTAALLGRSLDDVPRLLTLLLYGVSSIWLYAWSAAYHVVTWPPRQRTIMRAVDHANIYVVIAATSTAIGSAVLVGVERTALLVAVWSLAAVGVLVTVSRLRLRAAPRVGLYLLTGLTGLIALPGLLRALPLPALGGLIAGGLLYGVGGAIYALKRPDPFPRVFGYHEVFHLLVIAGGAAFALVIWFCVLPPAGG